MSKTIGIIGGMGPLATCDLFRKIIEQTDANCDQEHIRVLIDNNTNIPDRSASILGRGEDPVEQMVLSARGLCAMGADVLIMPCNTAHYFHSQIANAVEIPLLHMIDETAKVVHNMGIRHVGLLATDGTIQSGVYARAFAEREIQMSVPSEENQKAVMEMIYDGVKAGNYSLDTSHFCRTMDELLDSGAQTLILGCTELPIAFQMFGFDRPSVDPTKILAAAAIRYVDGKLK